MAKHQPGSNVFDRIPFKMHPRVFAALGADLVTNDVVAVIELVKNSYDAFAENVWIRFGHDEQGLAFLEVRDDGIGMTRGVIEDVWCVVATPFKAENPKTTVGKKVRRVAGEKGLGRLSVSRLGDELHILTQAPNAPCWELSIDWTTLASADDLGGCYIQCRRHSKPSPFEGSGTILRVLHLKNHWDAGQIRDLEDNLARLLSPFEKVADFNIYLSGTDLPGEEEIHVTSPKFLSHPKYAISGNVDSQGNITAEYSYNPIRDGKGRTKPISRSWEQVFDGIRDTDKERFRFIDSQAHCGKFRFEIRAWDIGAEDTKEIAERFDFQKSQIRKAIGAHKGISVYRDKILVLPKSDNARDWLGLDLRRVSDVGKRMSTSQLVGYVSISADANPKILDTSDRERLVSCLEVAEFEEILKSIVGLLENERDEDRVKRDKEEPIQDLFGKLSANDLIVEITNMADEGADVKETIPLLQAFNKSLDTARKTIQERFVFYSRMATVGTISQMLVHEIRNRTTAFGTFLELVKSRFGPINDDNFAKQYRFAENSVRALERLADTFSPLASRTFQRRKRQSILEERIRNCVEVMGAEFERKGIRCNVPDTETTIAVDPSELEAICLNLLTNAGYWLGQVDKDHREVQFRLSHIDSGKRVRVWVHDSGPGIDEEDIQKVFLPGVTRKPGGIGMGLTVASEIVADYGGQMTIKQPGTLGGASFAFDLPILGRD